MADGEWPTMYININKRCIVPEMSCVTFVSTLENETSVLAQLLASETEAVAKAL